MSERKRDKKRVSGGGGGNFRGYRNGPENLNFLTVLCL